MSTIQKLYNNLSKNAFFNLLILGVMPMLCMLLCIIITFSVMFNSTKNQIQHNVKNTLEVLSILNQEKINDVIAGVNIFAHNETVLNYLSETKPFLTPEKTSDITKTISSYMDAFTSTENIFVCSQNTDTIISSTGAYSIADYFKIHYSYLDYSEDYWKQPLFWTSQPYRLLSPTVANSVSGTKSVLPIIIRDINGKRLNNYIVVNINLDKLMSSIYNIPTAPSKLYVLNCFSNKVFSNSQSEGMYHEISPELYSELVKDTNRAFNFKINGQKHFIVSDSNVIGLNGFVYYFAIPFKDLFDSLHWLYVIIIMVIFAFMIIALLVLWKKTSKIYSPIKTLAKILSVDNKAISFKDINTSASSLANRNQSLSNALPYAQEKYLSNFLNSAEYTFDTQTQELILQSLPFRYTLFASVIIQFYPTELLYNDFNNEEYNNILQSFYGILKEMFTSYFDAFFLTNDPNSLSIILNLENPLQKENIRIIWENVLELLKNDREYVKLYFGDSNIYENLSRLKLAHTEALKNLKYVPYEGESYTKSTKPRALISRSDESKLYNYLIAHDTKAAGDLIASYQPKLSTADIQTKKNFYSKILSTILRVLQLKNISFSETQKTDYEFITEVLDNQTSDVHNVVLELINKLNIYAEKKDMNNIISYIAENYSNKDLSLEYIASEFNTNPSYISVFVKNNLKLGFHEYITSLRISEAKALLLKTDMPISEVAESVGFSSRTTFFRSFKQNTGVTPNEFRNSPTR